MMTPFFNPGPIEHPDIPIYIAGVNPYICRLAGELCDGFHVHPLHSVEYVEQYVKPWIAEGAARAGRSAQDVKLASTCFTIVGDTEEERDALRQMVRSQISFYASTPAYKGVFGAHGWEDVSEEAAAFVGMSREDARDAVVGWFKANDLLEEIREYEHSVGHSYRSHVPIEPYLSDQWYVRVTDDRMRGAALRAMKEEDCEQLPEGIVCNATLWAACIGGAMQVDDYVDAIEAAGLSVTVMRENPEYRFLSDNPQGATRKYGVKSVSPVATKN